MFNGLTFCRVLTLLKKTLHGRRKSSIVKFWQIWVWALLHGRRTKRSLTDSFLCHIMQQINAFLQSPHSPGTGAGSLVGSLVGSVVGWSLVCWLTKYRTIKVILTAVIATTKNISTFSRVLILLDRREPFNDPMFPYCSQDAQCCALHNFSSVAKCFESSGSLRTLYLYLFLSNIHQQGPERVS